METVGDEGWDAQMTMTRSSRKEGKEPRGSKMYRVDLERAFLHMEEEEEEQVGEMGEIGSRRK